tara:strand:+ start:904 stop:1971 length:1068 start_codon:yes stop_codon:yes gene_type:complete
MADQLQFRGGTTSEVSAASVASREIIIDTQTEQIAVGASKKKTVMEDSSGKVGIGTASPATNLEVVAAADGSDAALISLRNAGGTNSSATLRFVNSTSPLGAATAEITAIRNASAGTDLVFKRQSNLESFRVDSSGNVKIGGTLPSAPNIELNAAGSITAAGAIGVERTQATETYLYGTLNGTATASLRADKFMLGGTLPSAPNITLNSSGSAEFAGNLKVGGASSPNALGVYSSNTNWIVADFVSNGDFSSINFKSQGITSNSVRVGGAGNDLVLSAGGKQIKLTDSGIAQFGLGGAGTTHIPKAEINCNDGSAEFGGDITCTNNSKGLVLKSPDGTSFRLSVANDGTLSASSI